MPGGIEVLDDKGAEVRIGTELGGVGDGCGLFEERVEGCFVAGVEGGIAAIKGSV